MRKTYEKIKSGMRKLAITYVMLGSLYTLGSPVDLTGHHSSDIYLGRVQPTRLEKKLVEFLGGELPLVKEDRK